MNYLQKKKQAIIMMLTAQIIKTAQGYPATVNDCESGTAVDYTVWGNTVTGKNLLDIPSEFTWTGLGRKNSYIPAGQYVLSWTSTIWGGASSPVILFDKNAKKIYLSNKNGGSVSFTLTQPETTIYFYTNGYSVAESKDVTSTINQLMLELGETATEYEPYTVKYVGDKTLVSDNTYKYKIPIVNLGKNIISYPFSKLNNTFTLNGIKFTDNGDGTITANGTAKGEVWFKYADNIKSITGKYTLSGCPSGGSVQTYLMQISNVDRKTGKLISSFRCYNDTDVGYENLSFDENNIAWGYIYIKTGVTVENLTFKPQLELGETATEYEPYRVPVTANIYLDEPLKKGESINFGADNLPELQLFEGSNVITADTVVKPEKISVDYYAKGSD